jgi:hypothetical protein
VRQVPSQQCEVPPHVLVRVGQVAELPVQNDPFKQSIGRGPAHCVDEGA